MRDTLRHVVYEFTLTALTLRVQLVDFAFAQQLVLAINCQHGSTLSRLYNVSTNGANQSALR